MKKLASSTALLAAGSVVHALRIVVLSLVLGNEAFGAVSAILLAVTLFNDFGSVGFARLIYNQPLFTPWKASRQARHVGLILATGMAIIFATSLVAASVGSIATPFQFATLFLTLFCAAANMLLLSSFRASASQFTHPVGFALKSVIIMIDIVVLGLIQVPIEKVALWGEIAALPVLLIYAWKVGLLRRHKRMGRHLRDTFASYYRLGIFAVLSSASGMLLLNNERLFASLAMSLEQLGFLTKLLMPKVIAAQGAFLVGVHFHRFIIGLSLEERRDLLARFARFELIGIPIALLAMAAGGGIGIFFYRYLYAIEVDYWTGLAAATLALAFLFNPYSIMLQATNRFRQLAVINLLAVAVFVGLALLLAPSPVGILHLSASVALGWFVVTRITAHRSGVD